MITRRRVVTALVIAAVLALGGWIASRTYWTELEIPAPLRGEARTNPFYAAARFAETLDAQTSWDRVFVAPPADAVIVISSWHWNLSERRRRQLETWVESGGRLVVDSTLATGGDGVFESWSGIRREELKRETLDAILGNDVPDDPCTTLDESGGPGSGPAARYEVCQVMYFLGTLATGKPVLWSLSDTVGMQALRVRAGRGTVTVINGDPFTYRDFIDADHARLFAAATELRRGDEIHFLSEADHPSILELLWGYGGPAVALMLGVVALSLWRGAGRIGPLVAPPDPARRSLAEQIRGTGRFALRHGGGESLRLAAIRALDIDAARRITSYARLSLDERASAIAHVTGCDAVALERALLTGLPRRPQELKGTLALLEDVRRRLADRNG